MSETNNNSHGLTGFIVVLPNTIIEIPLTSNLSWLPLFYALPPELAGKRPEYAALPRNINMLLSSPDAVKLIEDDLFLELVWDCYAWSIWQFLKVPLQNGTYRDIPGSWSNYSGDFPLWRLSYYILCGILNDRMNSIGGQRAECNAAVSVLDTLDLTGVHRIVMGGA